MGKGVGGSSSASIILMVVSFGYVSVGGLPSPQVIYVANDKIDEITQLSKEEEERDIFYFGKFLLEINETEFENRSGS
jgi:hypothetical protein